MINFVIVEDNLTQMKKTKEIINKFMFRKNIDYFISEFNDLTKELLTFINKNDKNKIYILDFELPVSNAIDIAREIRIRDWTSPIIILSAHGGMSYETFKQRLQILDFVSKQFESEKNLNEIFEICLNQYHSRNFLFFYSNSISYRLDIEKILYIYRNKNRKSVIVTDSKNYETYINLTELNARINNKFFKTHKSCLVNLERVEKIDWKNKKVYFDNQVECSYVTASHKDKVENYGV